MIVMDSTRLEQLRRGVAVLECLLDRMDSDDHSAIQDCDVLEAGLNEIRAAIADTDTSNLPTADIRPIA